MDRSASDAAIRSWVMWLGRWNGALAGLSDEALLREVAPGRNRPIYLLGHLTAVHDGMIRLLGFGEPLYPELRELFVVKADREAVTLPSASELRASWMAVNERLMREFAALSAEEWMGRHTNVSEDDFALDPTRNRLSVLLNRTGHLAFHLGQLIFALPPGVTRAVAQGS